MKQIDLTEWSNWIDGQDVLLKMQVSPRTLQRWRINGLLPYSRVSGKCYYRKSDILALLQENYNGKVEY
ncbi:helix-turn-helix domain-containing protein [Proteiniphilum sp.]|uniref:helix-turn-helix domain-containing protein n=1 Tax=Proteiniphilum sp. TaxID=1926877 RepID=UPI003317CC3F